MRYVRKWPACLPLVAFAPALSLAYTLAAVRGMIVFHWYLAPLVPFYLLGFVALVRTSFARPSVRYAVATILAIWMISGLNLGRDPEIGLLHPRGIDLAREQSYLEAGQMLSSRIQPDQIIAAPEIGALGYTLPNPILDTAGLITPIALHYYPLGPEYSGHGVPEPLIRELSPDYLVALDVFLLPPLTQSPWFRQKYRVVASLPAPFPVWDAEQVFVFQRTP